MAPPAAIAPAAVMTRPSGKGRKRRTPPPAPVEEPAKRTRREPTRLESEEWPGSEEAVARSIRESSRPAVFVPLGPAPLAPGGGRSLDSRRPFQMPSRRRLKNQCARKHATPTASPDATIAEMTTIAERSEIMGEDLDGALVASCNNA